MDYTALQKEKNSTLIKEEKESAEASKQYYRSKKQRSQEVAQKKRAKKLEDDIAAAEERMAEIQVEMSSDEISSDFAKLSELTEELTMLQSNIDEFFEEWSQISQ